MGVIIPQVVTEDRASGARVIDGSLRFDDTKTQYLSRTPGSAGNRKTFTHSFWIKHTKPGVAGTLRIFHAGPYTAPNYKHFFIRFSSDSIELISYDNNAIQFAYTSNAKFRDPAAWYHVVLSVDTTQAVASDRVKLYVNGELQTYASVNDPAQNIDLVPNSAGEPNYIAARNNLSTEFLPAHLSDVHFIDGQALSPTDFGYTDALTNTWRPKKLNGFGNTAPNEVSTTWSNSLTSNVGFYSGEEAIYAFDGSVDTYASVATGGASNYINFACNIPIRSSLRVKVSTSTNYVHINGNVSADVSGTGYLTVPSPPATLTQLRVYGDTGIGARIYAIEVDGVQLINNGGWGINGFHLPFDGNSPIGEDRSGRGNNWTPVNFGGSNTIEKATGALPILNTVSGGNVATVGVRTDSNSSSLVLALPLSGSANDVSNQINSGSTTKTITSTGTIASDTSIYNFYGLSSAFSINSYYSTNSSDFTFGTGDFTIECWVYNPSTYSGTLFSTNTNSSATTTLNSRFYGTTGTMDVYTSGLNEFTSITGVPLDEWVHLAFCRSSGSTLKVFVNGTLRATNTSWTESLTDSGNFYVNKGRDGNSTSTGSRKFQDVRVYKGVAKYTSNFIPASTNPDILPDTPSGVSGGSKLTKVTDGAVAFDGTGDYLSLADSADWNLGNTFTIEGYIYVTTDATYNTIIAQASSGNNYYLSYAGTNNNLEWYNYNGGVQLNSATNSISINRWHHIALVNNSGTGQFYIDGVASGSSGNAGTTADSSDEFRIGIQGSTWSFNGFISNLRVIKGTALYTSNFTPPSAPLTNVTNTKLLCCQSNASATAAAVAPTVSASDAELNIDLTSTPFSDVSGNGISVANGNSVTAVTAPSNSYGLTYAAEFTAASEQRLVTGDVGQSTSNPFSIDGFFYVKPGSGGYLFDARSVTYTSSFYIYCIVSGSSVQFLTAQGSFTKPAGEWFHLRCTSTGIWYNGEYQAGASGFGNTQIAAITIGSRYTFSTFLDGYVGAFRFFRYEDIGAPSPEQYTLTSGVPSNSLTPLPILVVGNAAATNFNPFTTDINTVRGQESGYCTWNPLTRGTYTNGNLDSSNTTYQIGTGTIGASSGKWYWEVTKTDSGTTHTIVGVTPLAYSTAEYIGLSGNGHGLYFFNGNLISNGSGSGTYGAFSQGDILNVALDLDNGKLWFGKNGTWFNSGNPAAGTNALVTSLTGTLYPGVSNASGTVTTSANFGQKPFKFLPPDGFQPLNAANVRPSTVIARPDQYIGVTTYTGNGGTQSINIGFKPDFVWVKRRDFDTDHGLFDTVRGAHKLLASNDSFVEQPYVNVLSFTSDGFDVNAAQWAGVNATNSTYVAWTWKAGGSSNTFNIDDVGYANASDVNMSVGALNSSYYNQSQVWSNSGSGSFLSGYDATKAFDGSTATYAYATTGGASFTFSPAITGTTFEILVTSNSGSPYVTINGTNIPGSNGNVWVDVSLLANGSLSSIGIGGYPGSGSYAGFSQLKVDGKILVDQGVTPTQYPSIAATGCSVGTKQGFSIIQYQGNNLTGQTIKHGLTQKPDFILVKNKDEAYDWMIYHKSMGATYYGLFGTSAFLNDANIWADTEPTDEFFYVSVHNSPAGYSNGPNGEFISYLWHDVPGLQKFGSYIGTATADGPFIELGFRPKVIITKAYGTTSSWGIWDTERDLYNPTDATLYPQSNGQEETGGAYPFDILSNGFKVRNSANFINATSGVIYAAWAEAPSFNLYGAQSNAR